MTEEQATSWVYDQDETDDHHDDPAWHDALRRAFRALYGREANEEDETAGLWSLCCCATPNCGTRP